MIDTEDTIVAIASPPGAGARGIVRVSGRDALPLVAQLLVEPLGLSNTSAGIYAGRLRMSDPWPRSVSCDLAVWPTSRCYVGMPTVELHLLGAPALLDAVAEQLIHHGARGARPGEFTLRAFLAGRLDLVQCEAVLGVIDASDQEQLSSALEQLAGNLSEGLYSLRAELLDLLAEIEAGLDFADEDLELIDPDRLRGQLEHALTIVLDTKAQMQARGMSQQEATVALYGSPNAGKSSLLNVLSASDAAIVSPTAGTTRDWVGMVTEVDGLRIRWIDTAGMNSESDCRIDQEAQQHTREQFAAADLRLLCIDLSRSELTTWEQESLLQAQHDTRTLVVGTKQDMALASGDAGGRGIDVATSSLNGAGLDELRRRVLRHLGDQQHVGSGRRHFVASTAQRCLGAILAADTALTEARGLVGMGDDELLAAELRLALSALGEVTGQVYTDDVLDRIFSRFCIGK